MKIFYFTSTGNSLYVAKRIGGELLSMPKLLKEGNLTFEADAIGFVFPCYYLGVPRPVQEFLSKARLASPYFFAVMTYGNMAAGSLGQFQVLARKAGITLSYTADILMVDNYIPLFDLDEQIREIPEKNIEENLVSIIGDVKIQKRYLKPMNFLTKGITRLAQLYYRTRRGAVDTAFTVENACNSCRICEQVCPVSNITFSDTGKPVYQHRCEECFACTHLCPQNAIRVKRERSKARFRNDQVSLQEIIQAH